MVTDEQIALAANVVASSGRRWEHIEAEARPFTCGELMCRLFGVDAFLDIVDQGVAHSVLPRHAVRSQVAEAHYVANRERLYLAVRERMTKQPEGER